MDSAITDNELRNEKTNKIPEANGERAIISPETQQVEKAETTTAATTTTADMPPSNKRKLDQTFLSPDEPAKKIVYRSGPVVNTGIGSNEKPTMNNSLVGAVSGRLESTKQSVSIVSNTRSGPVDTVVASNIEKRADPAEKAVDMEIVSNEEAPKGGEKLETLETSTIKTDPAPTKSLERGIAPNQAALMPLNTSSDLVDIDVASNEKVADGTRVETTSSIGDSIPPKSSGPKETDTKQTTSVDLNNSVSNRKEDDDGRNVETKSRIGDSIPATSSSTKEAGAKTATTPDVDLNERIEGGMSIETNGSGDGDVPAISSGTKGRAAKRAASIALNSSIVLSNEEIKDGEKAEAKSSTRERAAKQAASIAITLSTSVASINKGSKSNKVAADEIVSKYINLYPIPKKTPSLAPLKTSEKKELENCLEIPRDESWRDDWIGNLAFADKDVVNPDGKSKERQKKPLFRWAERGKNSLKILNNLLRFVFHLKETPPQAKKILAGADPKSVPSIQEAVRRVSYDPVVLREDGWATEKSGEPIGASGGPHRIGEMVFWQGYEGVIIAYIHDDDLGDLWKAMWLEEFDTFDLEAEELDDARKKYNRKKQREAAAAKDAQSSKNISSQSSNSATTKGGNADSMRRSIRNPSSDFTVDGIEHGIVLAVSYSRGARPGVFWPARVMHFSEMSLPQTKRGSQKQKVDVVFLAPYWNAPPTMSGGRVRNESYSESLSKHGSSIFSSGPLFEIESIDATEESIQQYPYSGAGLDIDQLRLSFKFAGLPKAAFSRFVDSHRLAVGLRTFSKKVLKSTPISDLERTTAGLFEAHPMAAQAPSFPHAVLHLPFGYILSQLPTLDRDSFTTSFAESSANEEPAIQLGTILDIMRPPFCWGMGENGGASEEKSSPIAGRRHSLLNSAPLSLEFDGETDESPVTVDRFISDLSSLQALLSPSENESSMSCLLGKNLNQLLKKIPHCASEFQNLSSDSKLTRAKTLVKLWIVVKTHGEELISSSGSLSATSCLNDWRRACERIYKYITIASSSTGVGNGVSQVLTDSCCNLHITSNECFERAVRLPAALKAAKEAGAGKSGRLKLSLGVNEKYLDLAEKKVIRMAHSKTYLRRIKKRCLAVTDPSEVVPLTEDSDGNGGADTKGSKGSWNAALAGVGAAVQGVDMIMNGECVNVFCLTRPPGHHAGRELHAMKAVSNGFCLLNPVACAALYATSPVSEGGPGLRRVCVIDIDVHHGNGTQDILASTYDPRFFYVSVHAGGPDVNGIDASEHDDLEIHAHHLGRTPKRGIFPGRCGDYCPHEGVLNIPLGARVTSHALGTALVQKVSPAVERFSPELIIVSAGFDAHKNDPLGLGGLSAEDYGTLTEVICKLAHKSCSGRVLSVLEGGYGVPCCRPMKANLFDPELAKQKATAQETVVVSSPQNAVPLSSSQPATNEAGAGNEKQPESSEQSKPAEQQQTNKPTETPQQQKQQFEILDLGDDLPEYMEDDVPLQLRRRLDKCHAEGFMDCVRDHIRTLAKCNMRS